MIHMTMLSRILKRETFVISILIGGAVWAAIGLCDYFDERAEERRMGVPAGGDET